jgi:hypothetical protein
MSYLLKEGERVQRRVDRYLNAEQVIVRGSLRDGKRVSVARMLRLGRRDFEESVDSAVREMLGEMRRFIKRENRK